MTGALRNRSIRWIASLYATGAFAEWFGSVALMVLVYRHTHSATAASMLLICKQVVPAAIAEVLGRKLDDLDLRRCLVAANVTQAASLASIAVVGFGVPLFVLAAVSGAAGTVSRTLLRAGIARSQSGEQLRAANALVNVLIAASGLAGPAAAAFAVASVSVEMSLVIAASLVVLLAVGAAVMPSIQQVTADDADDAHADAAPRRSGTLPIGVMLTVAATFLCAFSMDEPALLPYSEKVLHAGVEGYGAIFTAWGVGLAFGGALFTRLLTRSMLAVAVAAALVVSAVYLAMGLSSSIVFTCFVAVAGGAGNGVLWVAVVTAVQEATPRGQEARSAARLEAIALAAPGIGIALGGMLADVLSPRATLVIPGVALPALIALAVLALRLRGAVAPGTARQIFAPSIPGGSA